MTKAMSTGAVVVAGLAAGPLLASPRELSMRPVARILPLHGFSTELYFLNDADLSRTLDIAVAGRVGGIRCPMPWYFIQPAGNSFDWTVLDRIVNAVKSRGLVLVGLLGTCPPWAAVDAGGTPWTRPRLASDYAAFCEAVARRYVGKIDAYEIWNEPNNASFFNPAPDATFYTSMVKAAYPKIKAVDGSVAVVAGALGSTHTSSSTIAAVKFLTSMYRKSLAGSCDAISFHPYDWGSQANLAEGMLYDLHSLMTANGDGTKKLWITEHGTPTVGAASHEQQSALMTHNMRQWQSVPFAGPLFIRRPASPDWIITA